MKQKYVGGVPVTIAGFRLKPGDQFDAPKIDHPDIEQVKQAKQKKDDD